MIPPPGRGGMPANPDPEPTQPTPAARPLIPAKPRKAKDQGALLPQQRAATLSEIAAFQTIEVEMGGRARMVSILSSAQLPKAVDRILGMMIDPRYDQETLAQICLLGGVSLSTLSKAFGEAAKTRGQLLAWDRVAQRLPDVAAAVMEDAVPGLKTCPGCLGARMVPKPTNEDADATGPCSTCQGTGLKHFQPDHDVQKTALKIGGMLDSGKAGPGVNVAFLNQQLNTSHADLEGYDQLMEGLDNLLYGKGRARARGAPVEEPEIEGEVVPDDHPDVGF